jgi:glycosyltransferase involved in cell wall biosynthesis
MMDDPKVSVIMPVFNAQTFLDQAICSILGQSFSDFELIIINDGSTDSSQKIIECYAESDMRVRAVSRKNRGLVATLNEAIDMAKGIFIARMDSDDIALTDRLERQVGFLNEHPSIAILGGQGVVIDERDKETGVLRKPLSNHNIKSHLRFGCPMIHPTYLVRREVFLALGGYREVVAAEDIDFLVRAACSGYEFGNLDHCVIKYRMNANGNSARNLRLQMHSTRLILSEYRFWFASKDTTGVLPVSTFQNRVFKNGIWFNFLWRIRNGLLIRNRGSHGMLTSFLAAVVSSMHYELLCSAYRAWRCRRLIN